MDNSNKLNRLLKRNAIPIPSKLKILYNKIVQTNENIFEEGYQIYSLKIIFPT